MADASGGIPQPRVLDQNGVCTNCSKSAINSCVTCLFCKAKFHAHGCNTEQMDICNASFYKSYKPLAEKLGNNAQRPGNFAFVCDMCLTKREIQETATCDNKLHDIQEKVSSLEIDLKKIATLIQNNTSDSIVTPAILPNVFTASKLPASNDASCSYSGNANWDNQMSTDTIIESLRSDTATKTNITANQPENSKKSVLLKPVLIINKHDDSLINKENMKTINRTMISEKVSITKSFKNKLGNTVFVCDSVERRDKLRDEIVKSLPHVSYKAPPPLGPVVNVVGFNNECTNADLITAFVYQNHFVKDFLELNSSQISDHINHIVTKPLKNNSDFCQALFRVSPSFRQLLKKFSDKVTVGSMRCKIYDRHNVKRCNNCYEFGHFAAQCRAEKPVCGFCCGSHQTSNCPVQTSGKPLCCNCKKSDNHSHDTNHPAYSFNCPVYKSHLNL